MGAPDFSRLNTLIHNLMCVEKVINTASIKNYNGFVATKKHFVRRKWNQPIRQQKKVRHRGIEDLINCAPIFCG